MEALFQQVTPILENVKQTGGIDLSDLASNAIASGSNVSIANPLPAPLPGNGDLPGDMRTSSASRRKARAAQRGECACACFVYTTLRSSNNKYIYFKKYLINLLVSPLCFAIHR